MHKIRSLSVLISVLLLATTSSQAAPKTSKPKDIKTFRFAMSAKHAMITPSKVCKNCYKISITGIAPRVKYTISTGSGMGSARTIGYNRLNAQYAFKSRDITRSNPQAAPIQVHFKKFIASNGKVIHDGSANFKKVSSRYYFDPNHGYIIATPGPDWTIGPGALIEPVFVYTHRLDEKQALNFLVSIPSLNVKY